MTVRIPEEGGGEGTVAVDPVDISVDAAIDAPQPHPDALRPGFAAALVFAASGAVLMLEILAVRLLAPYVGLTLETTTSIIGAVLAGIAAGAAIGGRLADRVNTRWLIVGLLVGGGLYALLTVPIVRWLGPGARGEGDAAALAITLLALVPSAAALSAVSPAVARLQLHDLRASGTVVGRLSAWATAGALVGTFGTGFVLVPLMTVTSAVLSIGAGLVLVGLLLALTSHRRTRVTAVATGALLVITAALGGVSVALDSPCDTETSYHCVSVERDPDRPTGRHLILDDLHHSYVDLEDPSHLEYPYVQWIAQSIDGARRSKGPLDGVFVGGGGFTLPRWLLATRSGSTAHVLEVDGELVQFVKDELALRPTPGLRITEGDARVGLLDVASNSADVVVGDAFGNVSVPWHLATAEWTDEIKRVMRPDALYALNVIDTGELDLLRAETATLLDAFAHVRLVTYRRAKGDRPRGGNAVLLGSDRPMSDTVGSNIDGALTYSRPYLERWASGAEVLRDDDAPADQLLTPPDV